MNDGFLAQCFALRDHQSIVRKNREQVGIAPPASRQNMLRATPRAVTALLVDSLHRRVHRVALDAVKAELAKRKSRSHPHGVGGITTSPGRSLANQESAGGPAITPVDPVQPDKADMTLNLVDDRPRKV